MKLTSAMKMSTLVLQSVWFCFLAALMGFLAASPAAAQPATGYVQISCEPGVQVFLDASFKGVTSSDQGGLVLMGVPEGKHQIKVLKEGFQPQEEAVRVEAGKVFEYRVQPFSPKAKIVQRSTAAQPQVGQKVGTLLVQSLPVACKISIPGLGLQANKERDEWEARKVPCSTYTATFSALGKSVSYTFDVTEGQRTHLFVNIFEGKVQNLDAGGRAQQPASSPAASAAAASGNNRSLSDLGLDLVWVAPGSFLMGSTSGGDDDERPLTQATLSRGFWLGKTEVTQAQWVAVMGSNPSTFQGDDRPVEQVSWDDAIEFCRKLTERERAASRLPAGYLYTLPTEAQREYACRAGATGDHPGELGALAWYSNNSDYTTHPVGRKQANAWGLYDMHGNVWEWCLDWYGNYPGGSVTDPTGAVQGTDRAVRGGSWNLGASACRFADRSRALPSSHDEGLGFRLALAPQP